MEAKCLILLALVGFCSLVGCALAEQSDYDGWQAFKLAHNKTYESRIEDSLRRKIFLARKENIEKFNGAKSKRAGYKIGLNHMSDWTEGELRELVCFRLSANETLQNTRAGEEYLANLLTAARLKQLPESVDWRQVEGRVTPVGAQGACGSCWAFSAKGILEGQQLRVTGREELVELSVQNLIDCTVPHGCKGASTSMALCAVLVQGGITDEESYPYSGWEGTCSFKKETSVMTTRGPIVLPQDEDVLKEVVAEYGPVSISINAGGDFYEYKSGVYKKDDCPNDVPHVTHALLIVGYGTDPEEGDYWIAVSRNRHALFI